VDAGYEPLARNWRCALGELDLVLVRGGLVVFCEVKTRGGDGFGGGHEAVTWRKRSKLRQLGEAFLLAPPAGSGGGAVRRGQRAGAARIRSPRRGLRGRVLRPPGLDVGASR